MRNYEGTNYHKIKNKYGKEVSDIIKAEVKDWVKEYNKANKTTFSVTISRNRGGWTTSLNFKIKTKTNYLILDEINNTYCTFQVNQEFQTFKDCLTTFIESFNYDKSDIMTDYFDVKFYKNIEPCYAQAQEYQNQLKTELFKTLYDVSNNSMINFSEEA